MAQGKLLTAGARLDYVRRVTGCEVKGEFARWIEAKSPQAVDAWATRNRITPEGALKIARATGASTHWLQFGDGEPFPNGPTPYPGAGKAGDGRIRALEAHVDALTTALAQLAAVVSGRLPGAGAEFAGAMRSQASPERPLLPELEVVLAKAEAAARSEGSATPPGGRVVSAAKPPRKGR